MLLMIREKVSHEDEESSIDTSFPLRISRGKERTSPAHYQMFLACKVKTCTIQWQVENTIFNIATVKENPYEDIYYRLHVF